MNKVEDAVIKYAIDFERYKNGQANEIIKLLDKANKDIAKFIKETDGVYTKARYKEIAKKLKDVSATLKENVDEHTDLEGLIDYELRKEKKLLELAKPYIKKTKGGEINFLYPSREQIKTSALFKPITTDGYGMTYQSYLDGIEIGLFNTWDSAVRTGYLTGQTAKEITRNVLGSASKIGELTKQGTINSFRNNVYSNTRTVLQSFANETMQRVYEENEKYFGDGEYKYEYLSTLDSRTCLVCAESSSKLYKDLRSAPHVPQHRGCVTYDTLVSTVGRISKVYKRRYKGLLYRITTASGNTLTVTPNHPILTDKGFVRAHLLNIGDNVICDNGLETLGIVGENKDNRQAFIKDVFSSFSKSPSMFTTTVPTTTEDFHGDSVYNKVHIVTTDRDLSSKRNVFGKKFFFKNLFINRITVPSLFKESHSRSIFQIFSCHFTAFRSLVSIFGKFGDLLWTAMTHPFKLLFAPVPLRDIVFLKECNHSHTAKTKSLSNSSNTDSLIVKFKNFINRKIVSRAFSSCINSIPSQEIENDVFGTTDLTSNIFDRYSTRIKIDNIIDIDVIYSFTHVYNLETENSWYIANGIITHNCRCFLVPYFNIEGDTKASKTGQIDSNLTFENWLKDQDDSTQQDVLGKFKFEQFQKGVPMKQFVDNGRVLTVDELKDRLDLKAYYGNKAEDFITQRYSNIEKELTKNELYSLQKYTTYEYRAINACSRRGVDNGYENVVNDIAKAVDKNEIGHSVTVFRGDGTDCIKGILSKSMIKDFDTLLEKDPEAFELKLKGKKFFDYGFTSTSLDKQKAEIFTYNVFLQIDTKANTKGIYLESITSHKGEKELLLGAGQSMKIKKANVEELNRNKILKLFVEVI